jgi:serine/threonine-protein kinase
MNTDYSGQTLDGRYRVIRLLGKGGMGSVYLGRHIKLGKRVAVKFLHTRYASSPDLVARFEREAKAASSVAHSNIINVMDVGESESGEPYLVMERREPGRDARA